MPFPRHPFTDQTADGEPDAGMFEAVRRDDYLEIIRLVEGGASPRATDPTFNLPVAYWAAEFGHAISLQVLISLGADKDCTGFDGERPLHVAARKGDLSCAAVLIITRADLNAVNHRLERPLHTSSSFGNLAVSYLLLISGADVAARDRKGRTPAERAEEFGYTLLECTFTWLGEAGRDGDACGALLSSLPFRMVKRWLTGFGLTGRPAEDARHLHMLTRLHEPCERGQHAATLGCEIPPRGLFMETGTEMVM